MTITSIEWTDATWNPVAGCTIISEGCTNCYAMRMASRLQAMGMPKYRGLTRKSGRRRVWTGKIRCDEKSLEIPLRWKKARRIFVNSMSDLFHEDIPTKFIRRVWDVMERTPQHTYQILTKRPERMAAVLSQPIFIVLKNVWLGTSVESPKVFERLEHLRRVPAVIRFVSFEPLIASVANADLSKISWAIVGGESGPKARPMRAKWVDEIEQICRDQNVAFFFKQWGGVRKKEAGRRLRGQIVEEMPIGSFV